MRSNHRRERPAFVALPKLKERTTVPQVFLLRSERRSDLPHPKPQMDPVWKEASSTAGVRPPRRFFGLFLLRLENQAQEGASILIAFLWAHRRK